jgi:outer membrane protein insertion porin family
MRGMSLRVWLVGLLLSAVFAASAAEKITDVKVRVLDKFGTDASDVLSSCSVAKGQELSQEAISKDVRTLLDTGRYGYAGVELEKTDGGVCVVYVVRRRYRFQEPLEIKGAEGLSERKIRKVSELKSGDYIDEPILAERAGKVRAEYLKKYYPDVKIITEIKPIEGSVGAANVSFTIEEGKRAKIKDFVFKGNPSIPAKDLKASFGERPWYDPRGWFTDTPVSAQDLEDARRTAEEVYQNHGYLDAKVSPAVREDIGDGKCNMVFNVTEGDQYSVESTAIRGVKLFPEREVLSSAKLKADDVAGQADITAAEKAIRDYYGSRGYADTQVRAVKETVPGKPGRMAITYDVQEGELAYVRNIIIRGNEKTKDKVIRREVQMSPGSLMNTVKIEQNERRLKNLGYFKEVRHYTENTDKSGNRDLVYEVEEQRTGNFMVGAGVSSVDSVIGFAEVSQSNFDILNWPNFTGGGQKARAGVEVGSRRQTYETEWTQPWLWDRPLALTIGLYRRMRWYDQYDDVRTGGSVGLSYPMQEFNILGRTIGGRVGVRYTLEMVQMTHVDSGVWYMDKQGEVNSTPDNWDNRYFKWQEDEYGDNLNSIARLYWSDDTRDQILVPTKGHQATLFGEVGDGAIGDNEFYKVGANYKQFYEMPWYKHVLSLRGRLETVDAYSGELPIYERLFLGGPRTIRGVEYRDIGPKVYKGAGRKEHAPIGGKSLAMATAEYTIPVFKAVRFATFCDAGSLSEDEFDVSSDFEVSVGVGLRIDIPGFPIRLDFATPVCDDDSYTDDRVFSFLIGIE